VKEYTIQVAYLGVQQEAEIMRLQAYAAELHRQLEKLWYSPAGTKYSDEEADAVSAILGPTADAVADVPDFDRVLFWYERRYGQRAADMTSGSATDAV
jgi:hypothetical protein